MIKFMIIFAHVFFLLLGIFFAIAFGAVGYSPSDLFTALFIPNSGTENSQMFLILELRLIRSLSALMVGGFLGLVGAVLQRLLRNPLADPFILGISAGGTVAASLATVFGMPFLFFGFPVRTLFAFIGCLLTIFIIIIAKKYVKHMEDDYIIPVIGLILNSFFGAAIMLMVVLAEQQRSVDVYRWMIGSLQDIGILELGIVALVGTVAALILIRLASAVKILSFSDDLAKSLGFNPSKIRNIAFLLSAIIIAVVVSVSGTVGFVGLIMPHIARKFYKNSIVNEWIGSAFLGAMVLLIADILSRTLARPAELPVGMFTALVGAPVLAFLLLQRRESNY